MILVLILTEIKLKFLELAYGPLHKHHKNFKDIDIPGIWCAAASPENF